MTIGELRTAARERFGAGLEIQEVTRDRKRIVWCRKEFTAKRANMRGFYKSITFNAGAIPADAIEKIEQALAR